VLRLLLARGDVEVNAKDKRGQTPLSLAASGDHDAVVRLLLARGDVDVSTMDEDGTTLLSLAASDRDNAM
jgi:ankyrin repeat protein